MASLSPVGQPGHVPIVPQQEASAKVPENAAKTREVALALIPAPSHNLGTLPRDVLKLVLRELSSRDLQSLRLDRYLNNKVIEFVQGQDMQLFQRYVDFLLLRFPDLRELLKLLQKREPRSIPVT